MNQKFFESFSVQKKIFKTLHEIFFASQNFSSVENPIHAEKFSHLKTFHRNLEC